GSRTGRCGWITSFLRSNTKKTRALLGCAACWLLVVCSGVCGWCHLPGRVSWGWLLMGGTLVAAKFPLPRVVRLLLCVVVGGALLGSRATSRLFGVVGCWVRPACLVSCCGWPGVGSSVA